MDSVGSKLAPAEALKERAAAERSLFAMLIALGAGGLALAVPPLAILALAALTARALLHGQSQSVSLAPLAAPLTVSAIVGALIGLPAAVGMLFAWRLYAETRWSVRESIRLSRAAGRPAETAKHALVHAWLTPLYGLALVAYTSPHMVAGLPLDLPHVPLWVPMMAGGLALGALFDCALRRAADWRLGQVAVAPTAHFLAHHTVFLAAFGLMLDVSAGIVTILAWRLAHAAPFALPRRV